ncbi:hypothetical protein BH23CHL2_BH23CHL2_15780 [soil metagenome]
MQRIVDRALRPASMALAAIGVVLFLGWSVRPAAGELSYGYATYYTAARLVRDGVGTDRFYDREWFRQQTVETGFAETSDIFHINPPPTALLLPPLAGLNAGDADVLWTLANVALVALAIAIVFDTLGKVGLAVDRRGPVFWGFIGLVAVYNPLWENIFFGQVYVLLLLFLTLAMRAYVLDEQGRLGFWLGLMFATKSAGAVLWGLLVLGRRVRGLAWGVGTILAAVLITSPVLGLSMWWEYAQRIPNLFNQPWTGVTAYQTTTSFIHHNLHAEPRSNASPLVDLPAVVVPLAATVNILLFGLAALAGWVLQRELDGKRLRLARFGLLSALMIPLQPLGEEYHYTLTLPAILSALVLALAEPRGARREVMLLLAAAGTLLITAPLHHTHPSLSPGFRALLAYPKLYGGLLIAASMASYVVITSDEWSERLRNSIPTHPSATRQRSEQRQPESGHPLQDQSPRP